MIHIGHYTNPIQFRSRLVNGLGVIMD